MAIAATGRDWISPTIWIGSGLITTGAVAAIAFWYVFGVRIYDPLSEVHRSIAVQSTVGALSPLDATPSASDVADHDLPSSPSFDVVRVERGGEAVVAGRGRPGSKILLLSSGQVVAEGSADEGGQFVIVPAPFGPGHYTFELRQIAGTRPPIDSNDLVSVDVPAPTIKVGVAPLVSYLGSKASPGPVAIANAEASPATRDDRQMVIAPLQMRTKAPFKQSRVALVVRGDNLWNISRARLGNALRYPQIFAANAKLIRDPDLIYPGQVLTVPFR